ncbi:LacI family DNA-binding transcriptional regulator [Vibrio sinensis]|uniref:LacI family DNA-binding transcriptional regulator n=1 Tax=Vibrio sinensis TaxID=2302434 RepID=UPI001A9FF8AF|nr:LacI family DNA-binding transcriptional regulator [Vibrio sinensis]
MTRTNKSGFATISDVAKMAGVGKTSVSRFLNGEKGKLSDDLIARIGHAVETLNYRPNQSARMLKAGQSKLIGLLLADITNPYSIGVMQGIESVCKKAGYMLMVCNTDNQMKQQSQYLALLEAHRVDGIVINTFDMIDEEMAEFSKIGCPFVLVDRTSDSLQVDSVSLNNEQAMQQGCQHLLEQHYQALFVVTPPLTIAPRIERVDALREFVAHNQGMQCDVFELNRSEQMLNASLMAFIQQHQGLKTAIVSINGVTSMLAAKALKQLNISLGSQIGFLSVDDPDWVELVDGGITALRQPTKEIGKQACQLLIDRINGDESSPQQKKLQAELIVRHSTTA